MKVYTKLVMIIELLAVNKQRPHRFHMERFNLKKLNEIEGKKQYRVEVSNRFAALEDLDAKVAKHKNFSQRESRLL
jgi:hypothetical protein